MKIGIIGLLIVFTGPLAQGQTLREKLLRQSPKLSFNIGASYESNLQDPKTYQNQQGSSLFISPRYRISKKYTLIGSTGLRQGLTQESRTDFTNTGVGITRSPFALGTIADLRPTLSFVLPTNEQQRNKDSLRGGLVVSTIAFFRSRNPLIFGLGSQLRWNNHRFRISARTGANIQNAFSPFVILGWTLGKFQLVTRSAHTTATTYRGRRRHSFDFDQSVTYLQSRKLSYSIGHNNRGSVLTRDGQSSNVQLFETKTSILYLSALYNF